MARFIFNVVAIGSTLLFLKPAYGNWLGDCVVNPQECTVRSSPNRPDPAAIYISCGYSCAENACTCMCGDTHTVYQGYNCEEQ